ncbi:MAG: hypothetical protein H6978_05370 [Gammaproteobacteria bacterium]|nr:hypothetical protein [Gammaproteobacteria bacterium]
MGQSLGLDRTAKPSDSIPAILVRTRALFELLNLWTDRRADLDQDSAGELARYLKTLVGLPSKAQAVKELQQWCPDRALLFIDHDIQALQKTLRKLELVDSAAVRQLNACLDELRWYCDMGREIYRLERSATSGSPYTSLQVADEAEGAMVVNNDPRVSRTYSGLFIRGIKVTARAARLWRALQREARSFLGEPQKPTDDSDHHIRQA